MAMLLERLVAAVVGLMVWVVANVVYANQVRVGKRGFRRFLAFWLGFPATFFSLLVLDEGSQPALEPPPDDEEALLREVRRDRARALEGHAPPDADRNEEKDP